MSKREWLLQGLYIVSAVITIAVGFVSYNGPIIDWLHAPSGIPNWLLFSFLFGICLLPVLTRRLTRASTGIAAIRADSDSTKKYIMDTTTLGAISRIDFLAYTAETLVTPWRHILETHKKSLIVRLLVRRPETDNKKGNVAEGCLNTIAEICNANPRVDIDVRFYQHDPLLRLQFFHDEQVTTCLAGAYRYDPHHEMKFVGAENNALLVLKNRTDLEKDILSAFSSRFEYEWCQCSSIRAVIFDMDGVLINSMGLHLLSWREALRLSGVQYADSDLRRDIYLFEGQDAQHTADALYRKYEGQIPTRTIISTIIAHKQRIYNDLSDEAMPIEGIHDVIEYLRSCGVPLAMVTGTPRDAANKIEQRLFPSTFKVVVAGDDIDKGKPNPEPYFLALDQLGFRRSNSEQCVVIENAPLGVQAAAAARIPVYGLLMDSPVTHAQLESVGARVVVASAHALLRELKEFHFGSKKRSPNQAL